MRRNVELSIAANLAASRLLRLSSSSRRYDVSNDHRLTAVEPLLVSISIICRYQPANYLPALAVPGFESKIGMAMFVQLLGDEATCRDTRWDRSPRCRNESLNQEEEYMTLRIPQMILGLAILTPTPLSIHKPRRGALSGLTSSVLLVMNFPPAKQSRDSV